MAEQFDALKTDHIEFINQQKIFFVATAGAEGYVNLSPKGMDSLRVVDPNTVVWLNLTGSGNESAAHVLENNRMTIMFCSFDRTPLILRLYGSASVCHPRDEDWAKLSQLFQEQPGARQIFTLNVAMAQTSCGYAVPYYEFKEERSMLANWAAAKGEEGLREYWEEKNTLSLDGKDTGIFNDRQRP